MARRQSTPAGNALFAVVVIAALAVLGWALWSLPGWLEGWRFGRTAGIVLVVVIGAALLFAVPVAAAATYAALGMALEGLGIKLNHPEPPKGLTDAEEARAAAMERLR